MKRFPLIALALLFVSGCIGSQNAQRLPAGASFMYTDTAIYLSYPPFKVKATYRDSLACAVVYIIDSAGNVVNAPFPEFCVPNPLKK